MSGKNQLLVLVHNPRVISSTVPQALPELTRHCFLALPNTRLPFIMKEPKADTPRHPAINQSIEQ